MKYSDKSVLNIERLNEFKLLKSADNDMGKDMVKQKMEEKGDKREKK